MGVNSLVIVHGLVSKGWPRVVYYHFVLSQLTVLAPCKDEGASCQATEPADNCLLNFGGYHTPDRLISMKGSKSGLLSATCIMPLSTMPSMTFQIANPRNPFVAVWQIYSTTKHR